MARQNTVEVVIKAVDEASSVLGSLGDAVKAIGLAALAKEVAEAGLELARLGSQAIAIEQRFVAFAGSSEEAARTLELVSKATQGTLSDMDAMQGATKLFQMGLADSAEEAANLIGVATKLGDQTMSVSDRVADFAALLANQSTPRLDNFGISSGKVKERVAELQAEMPGLSRETAFVTATMEEAQISMEKLGTAGIAAQQGTASLSAEFENFRAAAGKRLSPTLQGTTGFLGDLLSQVNSVSAEMDEAGMTVTGLTGNMTLWLDVIGITTPELAAARAELEAMTSSVGASGDRYAAMAATYEAESQSIAASSDAASRSASAAADRYAASAQAYQDSIRASAEATSVARGEFLTAAAALDELNEAQFVAAQLEALKESQEAGIISIEQYTAAQEALMVQFGLLTPQEQAAQEELERLLTVYQQGIIGPEEYALKTQEVRDKLIVESDIANTKAALSEMEASYEAGKVPLDEYTRATEDLRAEIAALEDKTVTISVYYEYPNGKDPDAPDPNSPFSPTLPNPGGDFDFDPVTPGTFTPMSPMLPSGNTTTNNNFNMQINTRATQSNVLADIRTVQALYGVR